MSRRLGFSGVFAIEPDELTSFSFLSVYTDVTVGLFRCRKRGGGGRMGETHIGGSASAAPTTDSKPKPRQRQWQR